MGTSVANYSGHILKLVPGDHQYAFPLFAVVIIWNGHDKFTPTQFIKANAVRDWKLGILTRHLTEAIKLFEEVEGDLHDKEDPTLFDSFFELRDHVNVTSQILGDRTKGRAHTLPPVEYGARSGSTRLNLSNSQRLCAYSIYSSRRRSKYRDPTYKATKNNTKPNSSTSTSSNCTSKW